jgi:hypothetical protein
VDGATLEVRKKMKSRQQSEGEIRHIITGAQSEQEVRSGIYAYTSRLKAEDFEYAV